MDDHIKRMNKITNRDKLLREGLRVVHERGYGGASVRDIVQAAGVPQGSFTNHFASKEAFGLEVLERYFASSRAIIGATLHNEALDPIARLHAYMDANKTHIAEDDMRNGCLFGNFSAEVGASSKLIQLRLAEIFAEVQQSLTDCLTSAIAAGCVPPDLLASDVAGFIVSSLQGAILVAKTERSLAPVERFERILFGTVLAT